MSTSTTATLTLALIKPDAYPKRNEILDIIRANGFTIVALKEMRASAEKLGEFYKEHEKKPFFASLCAFMSSGPFVALALSKVDAVPEWRKLIGPTNSHVAREQAPDSIRAKYGTDNQANACHGSANPADARRELHFFFPTLVVDPLPTCEEANTYLSATVMPVLSEGLAQLAKEKPANPTEWLGKYLLEHKSH